MVAVGVSKVPKKTLPALSANRYTAMHDAWSCSAHKQCGLADDAMGLCIGGLQAKKTVVSNVKTAKALILTGSVSTLFFT